MLANRIRKMFFKSSSPLRLTPPTTPPHHLTFCESLLEENIENAASIFSKWDLESSHPNACSTASLFFDNRQEAKEFFKAVKDVQSAMQHYITHEPTSEKLAQCQKLMQTAMKRLEKEFYQILKASKDYLDPESVSSHSSSRASRASFSDMEDESEDEFKFADGSVTEMERASTSAMDDLKSIADCMRSSGYAKECVKVYKIIRRSIVDEALYNLGMERFTSSSIHKMDWELLEVKIKNWSHAVKVAVKTLFYGERVLCDYVFSSSATIRESVFSDICKEAAMNLFGFPENVAKCKITPEKMFRILDLYEAISEIGPEIESIFSSESTSAVQSQAVNSLIKLGEAVRTMLTDFESAIQKEVAKAPVPGGGVHPITRYVMNYIAFLADYSGSLAEIIADWQLPVQFPLPESYFGSPHSDDYMSSPISVRTAWLVLVLLCKLDGKAELYKDVALSYLFLANNLQYVVVKVRTSNLKLLLGDDWLAKHETKVKQYAANYERMGWSKVFASLPENPKAEIPIEQVRNGFRRFNLSFEEAYKKQSSWVVPDSKLRDEIKVSVSRKIVSLYRDFYEKHRFSVRRDPGTMNESLVRFAPDDLDNYLSDLFYGNGVSGGSVSSHSTTSSSSHSRGGS